MLQIVQLFTFRDIPDQKTFTYYRRKLNLLLNEHIVKVNENCDHKKVYIQIYKNPLLLPLLLKKDQVRS